MKKLYYNFSEQFLIKDDIDDYISENWKKTSNCPFSKLKFMTTPHKSMVEFLNDLFTSHFRGDIDSDHFNWWRRQLPKTVKSCPGIKSTLENSIIVKSPCDIHLTVYPDHQVDFVTPTPGLLSCTNDHLPPQFLYDDEKHGGLQSLYKNTTIVKIRLPVEIKSDIDLLFVNPQHHGVVPWDVSMGTFSRGVVYPLFPILMFPTPKEEPDNYFIKKGQVLAYLWGSEKVKIEKSKKPLSFKYRKKFMGWDS